MKVHSSFIALATSLSCASIAQAQQPQAQTQSATDTVPDNDGIPDIVVTAQRRSERLQDVPITISSVSRNQLAAAGVLDVKSLSTLVAGFSTGGQGTVAQPSIRGVSTQLSSAGADNPNALYVDGVYFSIPATLGNEYPDIDHIEVLKGPQGTLFGRNATGGAIQIITRQPSFTPHLDLKVDAGAYTGAGSSRSALHSDVRAFVTGPLIDGVLAASLAASSGYTPGFFTNNGTGHRDGEIRKTNLRGKLLFTPSEALKITATGYYNDNNLVGELLGIPYKGLTAAAAYPGSVIPTQVWHAAYEPGVASASLKQYGASLKAELTLDLGLLTSLTAYNHGDTGNGRNAVHGAPLPAS